VAQVREMQRTLSLAPYQGRYRVALLLRFEEAHPSAANALLKTLEEPPPHVVLLLTAESSEQLLPTITSRCEVIRLRPLSVEQTATGLERQYGIPLEEAYLLAHLSAGRPGMAVQMHQQPELLEARERWVGDFFHLLRAPLVDRFAYVDRAARDPEAVRRALITWLSLWRDTLLLVSGSNATLVNVDQQANLHQVARSLDRETVGQLLVRHERTLGDLEKNANMRLVVENLLLHWPQLSVR